MLGSHNSMFDSPSFIQKILKKRSFTSKYNIRPLYTADIVLEKKQIYAATKAAASYSQHQSKRKTKTYNIFQQQQLDSAGTAPSLTPSVSSTTTSSLLSDSTIIMPVPSTSSPQPRKRPLSSEILIKIMDRRLLKKQQRANDELLLSPRAPVMVKSVSSSTTNTVTPTRRNKILQHKRSLNTTTSTMKTAAQSPQLKKIKTVVPQLNDMPYLLTQNNDEQDRMVAQHYLLRTGFGSDFNSPIRTQLQKGIVVLDVGCGPGTWTMEMSTAFPKSTFIGIDQSAFYPRDIKPRNCHFRTCGSLVEQQELPFPDNSIDYIYQRDMNWGLTGQTWQPLLLEYQRILKPGGWIECVEPDLETQNSLENECLMNDKLITGLTLRQQDPYAVHRLPTMLSINGFRRVEDLTQNFPLGWGAAFSTCSNNNSILEEDEEKPDVELASDHSPSSSEEEQCSEFARAMSSQYLFLLKSLKPWLSTVMNMSSEKYDEYVAGLPEEWKRAHTFINWHCIIAQKPYV